MSFAAEMKDAVSGFKAGADIGQRWQTNSLNKDKNAAQTDLLKARANYYKHFGQTSGTPATDPATDAGNQGRAGYEKQDTPVPVDQPEDKPAETPVIPVPKTPEPAADVGGASKRPDFAALDGDGRSPGDPGYQGPWKPTKPTPPKPPEAVSYDGDQLAGAPPAPAYADGGVVEDPGDDQQASVSPDDEEPVLPTQGVAPAQPMRNGRQVKGTALPVPNRPQAPYHGSIANTYDAPGGPGDQEDSASHPAEPGNVLARAVTGGLGVIQKALGLDGGAQSDTSQLPKYDPRMGNDIYYDDGKGGQGTPYPLDPRTGQPIPGAVEGHAPAGAIIDDNAVSGRNPRDPNHGVRLLARYAGAMSPEEFTQVRKIVDPDGQLDDQLGNVAAINGMYNYYLSKGDVKSANQAAASMIMTLGKVSSQLGAQAEAAARSGDSGKAAQLLKKAFDYIPNDQSAEVNGNNLTIRDGDGKVIHSGTFTPQQLLDVATGVKNGKLFWQQLLQQASKGGAGAAKALPGYEDPNAGAADNSETAMNAVTGYTGNPADDPAQGAQPVSAPPQAPSALQAGPVAPQGVLPAPVAAPTGPNAAVAPPPAPVAAPQPQTGPQGAGTAPSAVPAPTPGPVAPGPGTAPVAQAGVLPDTPTGGPAAAGNRAGPGFFDPRQAVQTVPNRVLTRPGDAPAPVPPQPPQQLRLMGPQDVPNYAQLDPKTRTQVNGAIASKNAQIRAANAQQMQQYRTEMQAYQQQRGQNQFKIGFMPQQVVQEALPEIQTGIANTVQQAAANNPDIAKGLGTTPEDTTKILAPHIQGLSTVALGLMQANPDNPQLQQPQEAGKIALMLSVNTDNPNLPNFTPAGHTDGGQAVFVKSLDTGEIYRLPVAAYQGLLKTAQSVSATYAAGRNAVNQQVADKGIAARKVMENLSGAGKAYSKEGDDFFGIQHGPGTDPMMNQEPSNPPVLPEPNRPFDYGRPQNKVPKTGGSQDAADTFKDTGIIPGGQQRPHSVTPTSSQHITPVQLREILEKQYPGTQISPTMLKQRYDALKKAANGGPVTRDMAERAAAVK